MRVIMTETHVVPSAGTAMVGALVTLELVDEDTIITVVVDRARTARGRARRIGRAVRLMSVLENAGLVEPGAGATGVGALVSLQMNAD
jgi:hypothetical protein